jgi:hypothetical protein
LYYNNVLLTENWGCLEKSVWGGINFLKKVCFSAAGFNVRASGVFLLPEYPSLIVIKEAPALEQGFAQFPTPEGFLGKHGLPAQVGIAIIQVL